MQPNKANPDAPATRPDRANVLLGVTGGIAAYKAIDLAGKLTAQGFRVRTLLTDNARRFVQPISFEAVTRSGVYTSLWEMRDTSASTHIAFVDWADVVVVAPATANILAKIANGICDDLLSTSLCACCAKPLLFAPAMNNHMWENPAVQANVARLRQMFRAELIGPATGRLACGTQGVGRMAEPLDIVEAVRKLIKAPKSVRRDV